jgi:hypothetical protein
MAGKAKKPKASVKSARPKAGAASVSSRPVKAKARANKPKHAFYFAMIDGEPRISKAPPAHAKQSLGFDTFDQVRQSALERLIETIEHLERRLWEIKRAATFEDYQNLRESS